MMRDRDRDGGSWPEWLEPLRPDEVTRARLHRAVMETAESMLRTRTWTEVASRWSAVLAPLAAGLAVASGALAYRAATPDAQAGPTVAAEAPPAAAPVDIGPYLAPDAEGPPALLIDVAEPSREAVLTAALVSR